MDYSYVAKRSVLIGLEKAAKEDKIAGGKYHREAWRILAQDWLLDKWTIGAYCAVCGSKTSNCIGPQHLYVKGEHWKNGD